MKETGFERHVRACNNVELPGARLPFHVGDTPVGWITPSMAEALRDFPAIRRTTARVTLTNPAALPAIARVLSVRGLYRWRGELFDVRERPDLPAVAQIDRGAIPAFGIRATGVHVNGLVLRPDGLHIWVARRAMDKQLDPGKLDHIVAGGVPSGLGPLEAVIKEAAEEASIPPELAQRAMPVATIGYAMERPEGLRRDWVYAYDLMLPVDFIPEPTDGEVAGFELWPIHRAFETIRETDDFKFNVNLVMIDLFIRQGLIAGAEAESLRVLL